VIYTLAQNNISNRPGPAKGHHWSGCSAFIPGMEGKKLRKDSKDLSAIVYQPADFFLRDLYPHCYKFY
jgi:hypothetical protein